MTARADLEEALAASFDDAHLAVYGDLLQREGDPRGELIAIDLAQPSPEASARRDALLSAMLGRLVRERGYVVRAGFVDLIVRPPASERCAGILDTPLGPYVRTIHISGPEAVLKRHVGALAKHPRPWLASLSLYLDNSYGARATAPVISKRMTTQLFAATPRLDTISVEGFVINRANTRPLFPPGMAHPRAGDPHDRS